MKRCIVVITLVLFCVIFSSNSFALYRTQCNVSYGKSGSGIGVWSEPYRMDVQFASGSELNRKTQSNKFDQLKSYALIWFNQSEVAIVELNLYSYTLGEFGKSEFDMYIRYGYGNADGTQVNSPSPRKWKIEALPGY